MSTLIADVNGATITTIVDATAEAEELAGFEAAIEGTELEESQPAVTQDAEGETPSVDDQPAQGDDKPEQGVETEESPQSAPSSEAVNAEQLKALFATSGSVKELTDGLKKLRDDAFGKIGGLERLIKQAEKVTDSGLDLTLTDDDFAEVDQEVPMLTKPLQKLVNKILKQAKVKVPTAEAIDVNALRDQWHAEVDAKMQERELNLHRSFEERLLTDRYPEWKDTVVKPEFKTWLANEDKHSPGYQRTFMESWSAREIGGVLKKFNAHQVVAEKAKTQPLPTPKTKAATPSQSRVERLKEAIPPKASSATPKPKGPLTEEDAFDAVG